MRRKATPRLFAHRAFAGSVAVIALLIAVLACVGEHDSPTPMALIDPEPYHRLVPGLFTELEPTFVWAFRSAQATEPWRTVNIDRRFVVEDGALTVESSSTDPYFFRATDIEASSTAVIEVSIAGPVGNDVTLFWARPGEEFAPERSLTAPETGGPAAFVRFDVAAHPEWAGRIVRLRIDPTNVANARVRIAKIEAFAGTVMAERLRAVVRTPWKVDLDSDTRSGRLAVPGDTLRMRATIPPRGAELRFSTGIWTELAGASATGMAIWSRVFVDREPGTSDRVFESRIALDDERAGLWSDHTADLSAYAGETVEIAFETGAEGSIDPRQALAVWTQPEVVSLSDTSPPNVILISIDTLRADHLSLYGYERVTSPVIDEWATRDGVTFDTTVVQAPWTLPSHTSMLTGIDALRHGTNFDNDAVSPGLTTLAEVLHGAGYRTVAITGGGYMDPRYGFAQGFDRYKHARRRGAEDARRELESGIDLAIGELSARPTRPLFLFLHTYDVHMPFFAHQPDFDRWAPEGTAPTEDLFVNSEPIPAAASNGFVRSTRWGWRSLRRPMFREIEESELPVILAMYDSGIAHMDAELGRLFRALDRSGLGDDSLVVLTSDHGELFGEHGLFGHGNLYDPDLVVPLVFAFPDRLPRGLRVEHLVRSIDIFPTILELVGIRPPPNDGVSLVPLMTLGSDAGAPAEAWSYSPLTGFGVSVRTADDLKFIYNDAAWQGRRGPEELYRLDQDPGEVNNLVGSVTDALLGPLRQRVRERLAPVAGLMVSIVNGESTPLSGTLSGPVSAGRVKAVLMPCECAELLDDRETGFSLPPGERMTLRLESPVGSELVVTGWLEDPGEPAALRVELATAREGQGRAFALRGLTWQEVRPDSGELRTGVRLWWSGEAPWSTGDHPAELAPDLLRQLRALGYIR